MLSVREIKDILKQEHISISKRRGQNFLVDEGIQKKIIEAIQIKPDDVILEIGPGLGALTEGLAREAFSVIAVEKDRALAKVLKERLSSYSHLQIIHQDILVFNIEEFALKKIKVVGNLPYYITTPIIAYLLEKHRQSLKEILITVQEEVGRRLVGQSGSKDYSSLSVFVQYFTQAKILFALPKKAFYPQPKVDSVFVHLQMLDRPAVQVNNEEQFFKIVRSCFQQRRKIILNSLAKAQEKDKVLQALQEAGINFQARPEELSLADFAQIENIFAQRRIRL